MARTLLFAFALFFTLGSIAQNMGASPTTGPDYRPLMIQGQLTSIRIVPGDKSMKLFVLGKKAVDIKPPTEFRPEIIKVTAFSKDSQEDLKLTPEGEYYTVTPPKWQNPYSLRIETKLNEQLEKLEVKLPARKP